MIWDKTCRVQFHQPGLCLVHHCRCPNIWLRQKHVKSGGYVWVCGITSHDAADNTDHIFPWRRCLVVWKQEIVEESSPMTSQYTDISRSTKINLGPGPGLVRTSWCNRPQLQDVLSERNIMSCIYISALGMNSYSCFRSNQITAASWKWFFWI